MNDAGRNRVLDKLLPNSPRGLKFTVVAYMATVMLLAIILTFLIVFRITSTNLTRVEVRRAQDTMKSLQAGVSRIFARQKTLSPAAELELSVILRELISQLELESAVVVDSKGHVVLRLPEGGPVTLGGGEPDLRRAMGGREMVTTRRKRGFGFFSSGIRELAVSIPIIIDGKIRGGIKARFGMERLNRNIRTTQGILIGFIVASTLLAVGFGAYLLSRTVIGPIDELNRATEEYASGNLDRRVGVEGGREIAELAQAFNEMAHRIQTNRRQLEENVRILREVNEDLERTRAELLHSEKLATVGRLAQGIAHEIGNPLSAVLGYLELAKKNTSKPDKILDYVEKSEREIARINVIIRELLDYSRPTKPEIASVDVEDTISSLLTLITGQKRFKNVTIKRNVEAGLPSITADRNQLIQVLVNLSFNAADSMPKGGEMEVGAATKKWQPPAASESYFSGYLTKPLPPGAQVLEIWVRDTGEGISSDNLSRLFDPFFTTKEPGEGTGLGLAICSRIIEGMGARLGVRSRPGNGAKFMIVFPLNHPEEASRT